MCVSQFREYCNTSSFRHSTRNEDLKNQNLEVRKEAFFYNKRSWYYVTDLNKMRKLAKDNNEYAKIHLSKLVAPPNH